MEISLVFAIAVIAGYVWWHREQGRKFNAVKAYAYAIGKRSAHLAYNEAEAEAERLDSISLSLYRALTMKKDDWRGKAELMETTWKDVCASIYDESVMRSAGLFPNGPGYSETVESVEGIQRKLEKLRPLSQWRP